MKEKKRTGINVVRVIVVVSLILIEVCVMVRNYIRKTRKPSYSEEDISNAIEKIRTTEWTYEKASSLTNIPIGTLASRIFRKSGQQVGRPCFEDRRRKISSGFNYYFTRLW